MSNDNCASLPLLTFSKMWNGWTLRRNSSSDLHTVSRKVRLQSDYHRMGHLRYHLYGRWRDVRSVEVPFLLNDQTIGI